MDINQIKKYSRSLINVLFNEKAASVYILVFAASIGIATFIENDFGTSAAQKLIFKTRWFEILLLLFSITLIRNIIHYRMIPLRKWSTFIFHSSIIVIFIGAAITRYFGYEGMMHIRENDASNQFLSADTYLNFEVLSNGKTFVFDQAVLFASLGNNHWEESFELDGENLNFKVKQVIPNPKYQLTEKEGGNAFLKIVLGGTSGREEYYLMEGQVQTLRGLNYSFNGGLLTDGINFIKEGSNLYIQSNRELSQMVMATQEESVLEANSVGNPLRFRSLYSDGRSSFVIAEYNASAELEIISENRKIKNESLTALVMEVAHNGTAKELLVYGQKGIQGRPATTQFEGLNVAVSYGAKKMYLPFRIKLYDFIMERYPGTNSAASYASEVQLIDERNNIKKDYRIFMNNILNYGGFRFFQSSFDKDELGTYLSVNHDFWGTWISYLGYFLLTLGLIFTFFAKNSRFSIVRKKLERMRKDSWIILIPLLCSISFGNVSAQKSIQPVINAIDESHAEVFSQIVVQDHKGRMKPAHTLSRELLRKVAKTESLYGLTADQILLSMFADKSSWLKIDLIKIGKHEKIKELLGRNSSIISYQDCFQKNGEYKLREEVRKAYASAAIDRGTLEKELMKLDERVNIVSMIFSGAILKIIPVPGDENNLWVSNQVQHGNNNTIDPVASRFFPAYQLALQEALQSNDYNTANQIVQELSNYQNEIGAAVIPNSTRLDLEILLNKMNVFSRLSFFYLILGLAFLCLLFLSVFFQELNLKNLFSFLFVLVILCFSFHTIGLAIRWYVSGRAPWSNGYESMIYIAWTSALAGLIFTRKSIGGLTATMILAGTILLVAMLSYLDPEITPLVPVLRSYWLTIHVSLIAGSYGFLMLGALLGMINLILMMFLTNSNEKKIHQIIKELSYISEITLIGGLVMISIGTYLGGVWANESWGRYWGWDAKETWALVTILVYAFILHMRLIPKLYGLYAYNLATLFGWASVIMTYFGVNYYLSGLHSYAAGDPIPIPNWVYIAVSVQFLISLIAYIRKRKFQLIS